MSDATGNEDTPALPDPASLSGQPDEGDNQDVAARKIYPTDPTGADPGSSDA